MPVAGEEPGLVWALEDWGDGLCGWAGGGGGGGSEVDWEKERNRGRCYGVRKAVGGFVEESDVGRNNNYLGRHYHQVKLFGVQPAVHVKRRDLHQSGENGDSMSGAWD